MRNKNYIITVLSILLGLSLIWGLFEQRNNARLKLASENEYHRSFSDFAATLDDLETNLSKSSAASTTLQQVFYLSQSWQQSQNAVKDLSALPSEQFGIGYTHSFINEIGEYTRILTQTAAKGTKITSDQQKILLEMHDRLVDVNSKIQDISSRITNENLAWIDEKTLNKKNASSENSESVPTVAETNEDEAPVAPASVQGGLKNLDSSLQKLPPFSYEGQTDSHYVTSPLGLPDKVITLDESKEKAIQFLRIVGYAYDNMINTGTSSGPFAGFIWNDSYSTIDICKQGGVVTLFRNERPLGVRQLDNNTVKDKALETLNKLGYDLIITSTEDFGSYLQYSAVNHQKDILLYPDKVKLTVATDTGQIIGFDSTAYWAYNHGRELVSVLTATQAKAILRTDIKVTESRRAVIAQQGNKEVFCYEFRGTLNDEEYLLYINAHTGQEEKIMRILRTPRGEYTQ